MTPEISTESDLLSRLVRDFESAEQATFDSRQVSERCRDYYDSDQYTDSERAVLNQRKQPPITVNRIKPKVDFLLGLERKQRNDPKAFPRTPGDADSANAATDGIRYVCEDNQFDAIRSEVFENVLIEGMGGVDISVVPDRKGGFKIVLTQVPWDRMFFDPHSRKRDYTDATYRGTVTWMDEEVARGRWPDAANIFDTTVSSESTQGDTFSDVPRSRWTDPRRKRVRIVEMWCRHGDRIVQYKFTKAGILEKKDSPYVDEDGNPEDAFEFTSAFVDRDGNRYGVVKPWLDIQDEINKRRSKGLHLMSVRQIRLEKGAVDDVEQVRRELAKPDGVVETNPGMEFEVLATGDMAAAQFSLLQEAKQEIDAVGVNAALSGTEGRVMSGRALIARQEGGMAELGPIFDQLRLWQLRVYRKVWNRIRQYWTSEKWIRVTDDEKTPRYVGLNAPVTRFDATVEQLQAQGQQVPPEQVEAMRVDPMMQQVIGVKNNVTELDVDIILAEVPDTVAIQQEQFELLMQLAPAAAQSGRPFPLRAIIKASQIRNKDEILEEMGEGEQGGIPPQIAQQIQVQQQQMEAAAQELAKREEAAKAEQERMRKAAHDLEVRMLKVQAEERELALQKRIAELEMRMMAPQIVQAPAQAMQ